MNRWVVFATALPAAALWSCSLFAQEAARPDAAARLEAMSRRAGLLKMTFAGDPSRTPPMLTKAAVLRAADPTRDEVDGAVWLWCEGQRPVAALCVLYYPTGKWNYEHISLTDDALAVTGRPTWEWKPKAEARTWTVLAQPVPEVARARQSVMRAIARRLAASETRRGETFALRLLDRPIYTYSDEASGVVEGALFAMSYGTNPELLVQLEARKSGDKTAWHLAFARMSAAELSVKLDDQELWRAEARKADDPSEPYYGVNELAE